MGVVDFLRDKYGQAKQAVNNYFRPALGQTRTRDVVREFVKPSSIKSSIIDAVTTTAKRPDLLVRGAYRGGVQPVLDLATSRPAQILTNPLSLLGIGPKREDIDRIRAAIRKPGQVDVSGLSDNERAVFQGSQIAGALAPYSAAENLAIRGVNTLGRGSRLIASPAGQFGVRRAADVASGQLFYDPSSGQSRLQTAAQDLALGTAGEAVGSAISSGRKALRFTGAANKLNAPVPTTKQTGRVGGKAINEVFGTQSFKIPNEQAEFLFREGRLPKPGEVVPSDYKLRGTASVVLDDNGKLVSWSTDNPQFGESVLSKKFQPGLSIVDVSGANPSPEDAKILLDEFDDVIKNHPGRKLTKYANKNRELPEVLGKGGKFGKRGDSFITELGFNDSEQARNAYQEYVSLLDEQRKLKNIVSNASQPKVKSKDINLDEVSKQFGPTEQSRAPQTPLPKRDSLGLGGQEKPSLKPAKSGLQLKSQPKPDVSSDPNLLKDRPSLNTSKFNISKDAQKNLDNTVNNIRQILKKSRAEP